jgi:large subunit ribosomal protein L25
LPADLPEFITVDLTNLEAGQSLHVSSLTLPKGVTAVIHGDDATVAIAVVPRGAIVAEVPAK